MTDYFIIPGIGNSGENHWQTYFESLGSNFKRIIQQDWDSPNCNDWTETIEKTLSDYNPNNIVLIGHSLGCVAIANWAKRYNKNVKGAMLVAPSDTESANYTFPTIGFSPMPHDKINFKTIVITSSNDPWVSLERAALFAKNWNSEFINIGDGGHINASSGHYKWKEGLEILQTLG